MATLKIKQLRNGTWEWKARVGGLEGACGGFKTEDEARKAGETAVAEAEGWGK